MKKIGVLLLYISILLVIPTVMAQISGTTSVDFLTEGWYCNQTETDSAWINVTESEILTFWTYGPAGEEEMGCFEQSANYNDQWCCPENVACTDVNGTEPLGKCEGFVAYCWQINYLPLSLDSRENTCENADDDTGESSVEDHQQNNSYCGNLEGPYDENGEVCYDFTVCGCEWTNDECVAETHIQTTCDPEGDGDDEHSSSGESCWWVVTNITNKCDTPKNEIVVTTEARWDDFPDELDRPIGCEDDIRQYPCPSGAALPFFTFLPFVISLMLILVIYSYIISKKDL